MVQTTTTRSPRKRNPLPAVHGTVKVLQAIGSIGPKANGVGEIAISGKSYFLKCHATGFTLHGWDEKRGETTHYDIPLDCSSCDCPDFISRADLRADHCCKHQKALRALQAAGKLSGAVSTPNAA